MNEAKDGCVSTMIWAVTLVIAIIIGITTWNWLAPESAIEYLCFAIGWGLLSTSGYLISRIIVALIGKIT